MGNIFKWKTPKPQFTEKQKQQESEKIIYRSIVVFQDQFERDLVLMFRTFPDFMKLCWPDQIQTTTQQIKSWDLDNTVLKQTKSKTLEHIKLDQDQQNIIN